MKRDDSPGSPKEGSQGQGKSAILQKIHKDIAKELNRQYSKTKNLNFDSIDLSEVLKSDDIEKLIQDDENATHYPVVEKDIEELLKLISSYGYPKITKKELKNFMANFPPELIYSNAETMMQGEQELDSHTLYEKLKDNKLGDFDPVEVIFTSLDKDKTGNLDPTYLKQIIEKMGIGKILPSDVPLLKDLLDLDKDGVISKEDFQNFVKNVKYEEPKEEKKEQKTNKKTIKN